MDIRNGGENKVTKLNESLCGKKILQLGNLAGWPYAVAKGIREIGIESENIVHEYRDVKGINRKLPFDSSIFSTNDSLIFKVWKTIIFLIDAPKKYKLIHYHSSNILPRGLLFIEAAYLKYHGVKTVISFGGGDARLITEANEKNKYFYRKKGVLRDLIVRWRWFNWNRCVDACATDPEMLSTKMNNINNKVLFMQPIDFHRLDRSRPIKVGKTITVMHVPTESEVKGTSLFIASMKELSRKHNVEFVCKRNLPQEEFYKLLSTTDIYLDELKCGSYGVTAAEAMSLGKVVVTYVRDDLLDKYPSGIPIYNTNPDTLLSRLDHLLGNPDLIDSVKNDSYEYALCNHDSNLIIKNTLLPLYLELLDDN